MFLPFCQVNTETPRAGAVAAQGDPPRTSASRSRLRSLFGCRYADRSGASASRSPSYWDRVKFAALVGLAAAVMIDFGDVVWWYIPWEWKIRQAVYTVTTWTVAGLVLAKLVKSE